MTQEHQVQELRIFIKELWGGVVDSGIEKQRGLCSMHENFQGWLCRGGWSWTFFDDGRTVLGLDGEPLPLWSLRKDAT